MDSGDMLILENAGVHTMQQGSKSYIINPGAFLELVAGHSVLVPSQKTSKSHAAAR